MTLLKSYNISLGNIYSNADYEEFGSKGQIIKHYHSRLDDKYELIFVDDMEEHLDSLDQSIATPYFAHWGYGSTTKYPKFSTKLWDYYLG